MARVIANDPHHACAANHLALIANLLDAGSDLHRSILSKLGSGWVGSEWVPRGRAFSELDRSGELLGFLDDLTAVRIKLRKLDKNLVAYNESGDDMPKIVTLPRRYHLTAFQSNAVK